MKAAFTIVGLLICAAIIAIIAAIAISNQLESNEKASSSNRLRIESGLYVREWIDAKTSRRYLVFDRYGGGIAVIEAPLTLEAK